MLRFVMAAVALLFVAGCENIDDISAKPRPIGEFALGHNVVVSPNLVMGPLSREISDEQWIASVTKSIDDRFSRYDGDQLYHFGVSLEGYVLAQPGVPLVLAPRSVLIMKVTIWDDAAGEKLNAEPRQLTILERVDGGTVVGSGLTKSAEEQLESLSFNAAKEIQRYIEREHRSKRWFQRRPGTGAKTSADEADAVAGDAEEDTQPSDTDAETTTDAATDAATETLEQTPTPTDRSSAPAAASGAPLTAQGLTPAIGSATDPEASASGT
jgi:hypothetical protein